MLQLVDGEKFLYNVRFFFFICLLKTVSTLQGSISVDCPRSSWKTVYTYSILIIIIPAYYSEAAHWFIEERTVSTRVQGEQEGTGS
jgi:hypothetical protein